MPKTLDTFVIIPPAEINAAVVNRAPYLEARLTLEFPGYRFKIADIRDIKPIDDDADLDFGSRETFSAIPIMGQTSDLPDGGFYVGKLPPQELVNEIVKFCGRFDFEKARRYAA